jgi:hypothetical protein
MGKYEFDILLREGESLLLFCGQQGLSPLERASAPLIYEQTMNIVKKITKGLLKNSQNHSRNYE